MSAPTTVAREQLVAYVEAVTAAAGAEPWAAAACARSLVDAQLAGHASHGVQLLPHWIDGIATGQTDVNARPVVVLDRGAVVSVDGRRALGPVVGRHAAELAIARAHRHGIALVLARDAAHLGRLGEITEQVADAGQVAILLSGCQGAGQVVAAAGGADRRLSNNPISLATPGPEHAIVADMALSAVAEGKVAHALARGEDVPDGWVLDADGRPTNDPAALYDGGALVPLGGAVGGHKGVALMVMVDLIAGILSGGGVCRPEADDFLNTIALVAIDVDPLVGVEDFDAEVGVLTRHLKRSRLAPGAASIVMPGERSAARRERGQREGIPLDEADLRALADAADRAGLSDPPLLRPAP